MEKRGPPLEPPCTAHVVCSITGVSSTCTTADRIPEVTEGPQAWPKTPKPTTLTGSPVREGRKEAGDLHSMTFTSHPLQRSSPLPSERRFTPSHTPGHLPHEPCREMQNSLCSQWHVATHYSGASGRPPVLTPSPNRVVTFETVVT